MFTKSRFVAAGLLVGAYYVGKEIGWDAGYDQGKRDKFINRRYDGFSPKAILDIIGQTIIHPFL